MISAGTYLRMRREAAGMSIDDVAERIVTDWGMLHLSANYVREIEEDRTVALDGSIERLRERAFQFDPFIYRQLVAELPVPALCRGCACSWLDACNGDSGPCAWAEPHLCTACADKPAEAPTLSDLLRRPGAVPHA